MNKITSLILVFILASVVIYFGIAIFFIMSGKANKANLRSGWSGLQRIVYRLQKHTTAKNLYSQRRQAADISVLSNSIRQSYYSITWLGVA